MAGAITKTVLLFLLGFALVACSEKDKDPEGDAAPGGSGGGEVKQARAMPEEGKLVPGTYSTRERFEPPFSIELGEGWRVLRASDPRSLKLGYVDPGTVVAGGNVLTFLNVQEVFEPRENEGDISFEAGPAPEDLVAWLQRHPHLSTQEPEPVEIGGYDGERIDALVDVPEGYRDARRDGCPVPCIPLFRLGSDSTIRMTEKVENRFVVVESVEGELVVVVISAPVAGFDGFLPLAQETLNTLDWETP